MLNMFMLVICILKLFENMSQLFSFEKNSYSVLCPKNPIIPFINAVLLASHSHGLIN